MTTTALFRFLLLCCIALHVPASVAQGDMDTVFGPMIRLYTPEMEMDSLVVTKENSITITGKVFSPVKVMVVMVGNGTTDERVKASLQGTWGDFSAKVDLAAGENQVVIMASDAQNGLASIEFRVRCEGSGARPRATPKPKPTAAPDPAPATTVQRPVTQQEPEVVVVEEVLPITKPALPKPVPATEEEEGVISRDQALGGSATVRSTGRGTVHAVVVGVSRYESDPALELRYAVRDAQAFGEHLLASDGLGVPRANVTFLMNGEASAEALRIEVREAAARAGKDDLLIFYFAGHGINDGSGRLCLLPYDASTATDQSMWATGFTQGVLMDALMSSRSERRLVILDACQSGLLADGNAGVDGRSLASGDGKVHVLTATGPGQLAHESDRLGGGHGLFSYALMRGLKGEADGAGGEAKDGVINLNEAYQYVRRNVAMLADDLGGGVQQPMLHGGEDASIILTRRGSAATMTTAQEGERPVTERPGSAAVEAKPVDHDPRFVAIPQDKTEIDGMVFADEETGEKVRFYGTQPTSSYVSGIVNGEIFYGRAGLKGKTFEFADQDAKGRHRKWTLEMSTEWSELRVNHTIEAVTSPTRTLRRLGVPKREELTVGKVFADPVQDQRLQVVQQGGSWMRITGNLGTRIVDLVARSHGDVYDLVDEGAGWQAKGRLVMSDRWDGLSGSITFEDGKQVPFILRLQETTPERPLEDITYRDVMASGWDYEVTFYEERPGSVKFNGNMRPGKVEVTCQKHGDVLHCTDHTGKMEPFRLLLKNDRKKLLGNITLKTERGIFVVEMNRVSGTTPR